MESILKNEAWEAALFQLFTEYQKSAKLHATLGIKW